jgi:hypothetical protein
VYFVKLSVLVKSQNVETTVERAPAWSGSRLNVGTRSSSGYWPPKSRPLPDNGAGRRTCARTSPGMAATVDGRRNHLSPCLARAANSHPAGSGGDRSGADCQQVSCPHNFTPKSKIDHTFVIECLFFSRRVPSPSPGGPRTRVPPYTLLCVPIRRPHDRRRYRRTINPSSLKIQNFASACVHDRRSLRYPRFSCPAVPSKHILWGNTKIPIPAQTYTSLWWQSGPPERPPATISRSPPLFTRGDCSGPLGVCRTAGRCGRWRTSGPHLSRGQGSHADCPAFR